MLYLALGTNMGDKVRNLEKAIKEIERQIGTVVSRSAFVSTEPWGFQSDNGFLNACIAVDTDIPAELVLQRCQMIEKKMGRKTKSTKETMPDGTVRHIYHDRVIDIDIIIYDELIIHTPTLTIPHPLMDKRKFVLEPLAQIAAELKIPGTQISVAEMLSALEAEA
jgi:2-amino-4-hydroxy-6-hydroxymethyldihydropteridine diphosphokinase